MKNKISREVTLNLALEFVMSERDRCAALIPAETFDPYLQFLLMQPLATVH